VDIFSDLSWPDVLRDGVRLVVAAVLGSVIGVERLIHRHYAGLRTHTLVALGGAAFMLLGMSIAHGDPNAASRALQGIVTGIGFLGAGTILKLQQQRSVRGLTTAAGMWCAAGVGVATGAGCLVEAAWLTVIAILVLWALRVVELQAGVPKGTNRGRKP